MIYVPRTCDAETPAASSSVLAANIHTDNDAVCVASALVEFVKPATISAACLPHRVVVGNSIKEHHAKFGKTKQSLEPYRDFDRSFLAA